MRVAIAEYGLEGQTSYRYYQARGDDVTIVTNRVSLDFPIPEGAKSIVRDDVFDDVLDFDIVLRSPPRNPSSLKTTGKIWSATNEFFAKCPAPIIGVTGTKGKGTTSSLIAAILRASGKTVHLVGNIGTPALDVLPDIAPDDIVVFELSSFQLWDLERSPHIAVVLPIEADHLDVHDDFDDYIRAKSHIVTHQSAADVVVYHDRNEYSRRIGEQSVAERRITYPRDIPDEYKSALRLPGAHNVENATAAVLAVSSVVDVPPESIIQGFASFHGLPHRLRFVAEKNGVSYYDDSIATTPGSAIAAIQSFDQPKILILGGFDKGADYSKLIELCVEKDVLIIAMGANRQKIADIAAHKSARIVIVDGGIDEVVTVAADNAPAGSVVILSPAAASFDMFKNYADRGEKFIKAVETLT